MEFVIDNELRDFIYQPDTSSYGKLETLLLADGVNSPLVVWKEEKILVDGHRRWEIIVRHKLKYKVTYRSFSSRDAVKVWMLTNALHGVRQFTKEQMVEYEAKLVQARMDMNKHRRGVDVYEQVAQELGKNRRTLVREVATGKALLSLPKDMADDLKSGKKKATQKDIKELATLQEHQQRAVWKETDEDGISEIGPALRGLAEYNPSEPVLEVTTDNPKLLKGALSTLGRLSRDLDSLHGGQPNQAKFDQARRLIIGLNSILESWA